ncbi:hypothetical protein [Stappia indica]|uniref:hypothetical protein n=1 Tax=Stappia indica TaxID=538381 RepID=UPI001CD580F0|nr:hypothetical protein [Stappia indica]MCA1300037.1 hypothetical protein [Stappia indica]
MMISFRRRWRALTLLLMLAALLNAGATHALARSADGLAVAAGLVIAPQGRTENATDRANAARPDGMLTRSMTTQRCTGGLCAPFLPANHADETAFLAPSPPFEARPDRAAPALTRPVATPPPR